MYPAEACHLPYVPINLPVAESSSSRKNLVCMFRASRRQRHISNQNHITKSPLLYSVFQTVGSGGGGSRTVADAVVVMPPHSSFGGFPDERGTEAFLRKALEGCQLPVFLYSASGELLGEG